MNRRKIVFTELAFQKSQLDWINETDATPWAKTQLEIKAKHNINLLKLSYKYSDRDFHIASFNYLKEQYFFVMQILSVRLNKIHNLNEDVIFWSKALGFLPYRLLCALHDKYVHLYDLNLNQNQFCILDPSDFVTPNSFEDTFKLVCSSFGVEQACSIYLLDQPTELFPFNSEYKTIPVVWGTRPKGLIAKKDYKIILNKKTHNLFKKILRKCFNLIKSHSPTNLFIRAFISLPLKNRLDIKTKFSNAWNELDQDLSDKYNSPINVKARNTISEFSNIEDPFLKYYFKSLYYFLPKNLLENFNSINQELRKSIIPSIKFIISESWLGDENISFLLALYYQKKVQHVHLQHGWVFMYEANTMWLEEHISDHYLTTGYSGHQSSKLIPGGYFRDFPKSFIKLKRKNIFYFSTTSPAYTYQLDENIRDEQFIEYINDQIYFLNNVPAESLSRFFYRPYPVDYGWGILSQISNKVNVDDITILGIDRIASAELVIFDVYSTGYIESMLLNTPTIIIINTNFRFIKCEYTHILSELVEAKVIHNSAKSALDHYQKIWSSPEVWWSQEKVQKAVKSFIQNYAKAEEHAFQALCEALNVK